MPTLKVEVNRPLVRAAAIVAHHDDAILWMGGTILRTRVMGWHWTVVAMCVPNEERRQYFERCCESLMVRGVALRFQDYQPGESFSKNNQGQMSAALADAAGDEKYQWVFTHNRNPGGEYGRHANHAEVVTLVTDLAKAGKICDGVENVAYACYQQIYRLAGVATAANLNAGHYLQLSYSELLQKCDWCLRAPDAATNLKAIYYPCPNPEAFEGDARLPRPFVARISVRAK